MSVRCVADTPLMRVLDGDLVTLPRATHEACVAECTIRAFRYAGLQHKTLSVSNGEWHTTAEATVGEPHQGKLRVNVELKPIHTVCNNPIAPHGCVYALER